MSVRYLGMSVADRITLLRIFLSPVFFTVFYLSGLPMFSGLAVLFVTLLWVISVIAEISDLFDGMAARKMKEVSDFGKFFDPFADTVFQITAFLCFVQEGIFPAVLYLIVIYREFGILFIRNLMQRKGITMGARKSGKAKTATYITAGTIALVYVSMERLNILVSLQPAIKLTALVVFCISVCISVISFFDYFSVYLKENKEK